MGDSLAGSKVVQSIVFGREPEGAWLPGICCSRYPHSNLVRRREKCHKVKVAVFTNPIDIAQTETKDTVLIKKMLTKC